MLPLTLGLQMALRSGSPPRLWRASWTGELAISLLENFDSIYEEVFARTTAPASGSAPSGKSKKGSKKGWHLSPIHTHLMSLSAKSVLSRWQICHVGSILNLLLRIKITNHIMMWLFSGLLVVLFSFASTYYLTEKIGTQASNGDPVTSNDSVAWCDKHSERVFVDSKHQSIRSWSSFSCYAAPQYLSKRLTDWVWLVVQAQARFILGSWWKRRVLPHQEILPLSVLPLIDFGLLQFPLMALHSSEKSNSIDLSTAGCF